MKIKQVGTGKSSTGFASMPGTLRLALLGMTVNEALAAGKIDDLGDAKGRFAFPHQDENIDRWYAVVQGYAVPISARASGLCEDGALDAETIGNMKFTGGISDQEGDGKGKEWFNLGMGGNIRINTEADNVVVIGAVPVGKE